MKIPVYFLGTGQAIPTPRRNHTSVLISYKSENILFDCGEGTQRQFRRMKLNPCSLTKIMITHWHGDHILGLPGLLQTLALNKYNRKLDIYIPKTTSHFMDLLFKIFVFKGKIDYEIHECESGKIFENEDFYLEAEKMDHGTPCVAYSFVEKEKIRIDKKKLKQYKIEGKIISDLAKGKDIEWNGKKIKAKSLIYKQEQRKITFMMDTAINSNMVKIANGADLLISESTFLESSEKGKTLAEEYKHLTAKQAAETAKKAKVKKLVLAHMSQRYEGKERLILQEARKTFKNTEIAEDLTKTEI